MDTKYVRYFLSFASYLSFSKAARECGVRQSTISKAVQKLEQDYGGILVFRDGKDTRLTELGKKLSSEFERIVEIENNTRIITDDMLNNRGAELNIGISSTLSIGLLGEFLAALGIKLPEVRLILHEVSPEQTAQMVLSGVLDCCFCTDFQGDEEKLLASELFIERLLLYFSPEHRFSDAISVRLRDLEEESYIDRLNCEFRARVLKIADVLNIQLRPRLLATREDWLQSAIAHNLGVSFVPEHSVVEKNLKHCFVEERPQYKAYFPV